MDICIWNGYIDQAVFRCFKHNGASVELGMGPINQALRKRFEALCKNNADTIVEGVFPSSTLYAGASVISPGAPPSPYAPIVDEYQLKDSIPFQQWRKRMAEGEILASSYVNEKVKVLSFPGFSGGTFIPNGAGQSYNRDNLVALGLLEYVPSGPSFTKYYLREADVWVTTGSFTILYNYRRNCNWAPPYPISAVGVAQEIKGSHVVDSGTVTALVASANKGTLDALTALAEGPQALSWLNAMAARVSSLIRGVKQRRLSVSAAFERRKTLLAYQNKREDMKLLSLMNDISDSGKKISSRRKLKRELRKLQRQRAFLASTYKNTLRQTGIEFNDAMAQVWMEFRYAIMPLVYTAVDITEALGKTPKFQTYRDGEKATSLVSIHPDIPKAEISTHTRFWIKDKISLGYGPFSLNMRGISGNILTTAWELIPLSFVVDWFVNVGDFITAVSGSASSERSFTISHKDVFDYNYTDASSGRRVIAYGQLYNRKVDNTFNHTCLDIGPGMTWKRYTDSIALLWNANRENLIRSSNRTRSKQ